MSKKKATLFTMLFGVLNSIVFVVLNMIYTNLVILKMGSDVNGLISTVTQFVTLFSIAEGGVTTAAVVACYIPIHTRDYDRLNNILSTVKVIFRRIAILVFLLALTIGWFYANQLKSPFNVHKTYLLIVISALTISITIGELSRMLILIQGDNKEYIVQLSASISKIVSWLLSIHFIIMNYDVIWIYLCNLINVGVNIICIWIFERKNYTYIKYNDKIDYSLIRGTKDVYIQKIANTVFNSTDLIIISCFVNLSAVSVYNLYIMIYRAVASLVNAIAQAPYNSFGQLYAESRKEDFIYFYNMYWSFIILVVTIVFTTSGIAILPFVSIYTQGVTDYIYLMPSLNICMFIFFTLQTFNAPFGVLLNSTGNFKRQNAQCIVAAITNIISSVILVNIIGTYGVICGSVLSIVIVVTSNVIKIKKVIPEIDTNKIFFIMGINLGFGVLLVLLSYRIHYTCSNYFYWIVISVLILVVCTVILTIINIVCNGKNLFSIIIKDLKNDRNKYFK